MRFEHFALNVPDASSHAAWYAQHLGMIILSRRSEAPFTHFLADETGRVFLELYTNPAAPYPDYRSQHELIFHWAMTSQNIEDDCVRLAQAGARLQKKEVLLDGSVLAMMRDPWGVALQLCQRAAPFPDNR